MKNQKTPKSERKVSIFVTDKTADRLKEAQRKLSEKNGFRISLSQTGATLLNSALEQELQNP